MDVLKILFSFLIAFCLVGIVVHPIMAKIDPETIVAAWPCDEGKGRLLRMPLVMGMMANLSKRKDGPRKGDLEMP